MQHLEKKNKQWKRNLHCLVILISGVSKSHFVLCHPSLLLAPCVRLALFSFPVNLGVDDEKTVPLFAFANYIKCASWRVWLCYGVDVFICVLGKSDCVHPHISTCVSVWMLRATCTSQHIWRWSKQKPAGHMSSCRCCSVLKCLKSSRCHYVSYDSYSQLCMSPFDWLQV